MCFWVKAHDFGKHKQISYSADRHLCFSRTAVMGDSRYKTLNVIAIIQELENGRFCCNATWQLINTIQNKWHITSNAKICMNGQVMVSVSQYC